MLEELESRFQLAVQSFWNGRAAQQNKQLEKGKVDGGTRGAATGGAHMAALEALVAEELMHAGVPPECIFTNKDLELPGYYRPEKRWDLLVVVDSRLVVAIEFKSQVGPSFGNNFNNRTEEALGNAEDIWTAYREGRLGRHPAPFLGYMFLLEDCDAVHTAVKPTAPHFSIDPIFESASYAKRYEILCERLVLERKYSAACLTLATNIEPTVVSWPSSVATFRHFIAQMDGHVRTFLNSR